MSISSENDKIPSNNNRAVPISCAGLLTYHYIWVILKWLEKFRSCLFTELGQFILLRFYLWIWGTNYIQWNFHCLRSRLQAYQLFLLFFCHLKVWKHLCLLLVKYLFTLFLKHLARTITAIPDSLFVVNCCRMVIFAWGYETVLLPDLMSVNFIPIFLLYTLLIKIFILQIRVIWFLINLSWWILLERDPFAILCKKNITFRL